MLNKNNIITERRHKRFIKLQKLQRIPKKRLKKTQKEETAFVRVPIEGIWGSSGNF
ncbi:MAG: hypothetical protein PHH83_02495 [Patescibacteria group bacterium]|nr:hypothetical protein [Patescibacteria group bacterium]